MSRYAHAVVPPDGQKIADAADGGLHVPDRPIVPFIEGDGIGPDIWAATRRVVDAAVAKAYDGGRSVAWMEVLAGEKANERTGEWLPQETLDALTEFRVAVKDP